VTDPIWIERTDRGEAVRDLQQRLVDLGYTIPIVERDGTFGPGTEDAVRCFQVKRGLRVDGIVGSQTWRALDESRHMLGDRLLYLKAPMIRGDDVGSLQRQLNALGFDAGREDAIFGLATQAALREFQRNVGLSADGICGPDSVAALARFGPPRDDSIARVRELERLRSGPAELRRQQILIVVEPGLDVVGVALARSLTHAGASVLTDVCRDDHSQVATRANQFAVDVLVALRWASSDGDPSCSYFASGPFRSEAGYRMASEVQRSLSDLVPMASVPTGGRVALLRESRMPAIVIELVRPGDVRAMSVVVRQPFVLGDAIALGLRSAIEAHTEPDRTEPDQAE
jgi:N-acetylmuramoyl-L-alanine amidase